MKTTIPIIAVLATAFSVAAHAQANPPSQATPPILFPDRTVLPIQVPKPPFYTELDVRDAPPPPPRFEVKAPDGAPNVLIILIDDMGFGQSSGFGGPIEMPTIDRQWSVEASMRWVRPSGRLTLA